MRPSRRCTLLSVALLIPSILSAQQRGIEIGLDGGLQYSIDAELLAISVPFQRVRAAFPSGARLAFEPGLAFTRLSSGGASTFTSSKTAAYVIIFVMLATRSRSVSVIGRASSIEDTPAVPSHRAAPRLT